MESYNIDTDYLEYSNDVVFYAFKKAVKGDLVGENSLYQRSLSISHLMKYVTNEHLLNNIIQFLKECELLSLEREVQKYLDTCLSNEMYSDIDCVRIRAFVFSSLFKYQAMMKNYKPFLEKDIPEFRFDIKGRLVYDNSDSINEKLKPRVVNHIIENVVEVLPTTKEVENEYKKMINAFAKQGYEYTTNYFEKDIEYLTTLRDNIVVSSRNPYPDIFRSYEGYKIFEEYSKGYIVNIYKDYSFLYQQLLKERRIEPLKHLEFAEWLNEKGYIKLAELDNIISKKGFDNKSKSENRLNNYFRIIDSIESI